MSFSRLIRFLVFGLVLAVSFAAIVAGCPAPTSPLASTPDLAVTSAKLTIEAALAQPPPTVMTPAPMPELTATSVQPSSAVTSTLVPVFQTISLQPWSELASPETNLGLPPGQHRLLEIPFVTGWTSSTQCSYSRARPEVIQVDTHISNPVGVYLLIQAGWGLTQYDGQQIGNVRLEFSDGSSFDTPLILGFNIRDWAWENPMAVNTASSLTLQPAWKGKAPNGTPGGMDILTIDIPDSQARSMLTKIEISDLSQSMIGDINPCIHVVALTVKNLH